MLQKIQAHLRSGGVVQITTYTRSTLYRPQHAGLFSEDAHGVLCVKSGRQTVRLADSNGPLASIRFGRWERVR